MFLGIYHLGKHENDTGTAVTNFGQQVTGAVTT